MIKNIGRKKSCHIPEEVYLPDGPISSNTEDVPHRWITYYGFNNIGDSLEKDLYVNHVKGLNEDFQLRSTFGPFMEYDRDFTITKVTNIVKKSEDRNASGYDGIANEFMKK